MPADPDRLIDADSEAIHRLRLAQAKLACSRVVLANAVAEFIESWPENATRWRTEVVRASARERQLLAEMQAASAAWEAAVAALVQS